MKWLLRSVTMNSFILVRKANSSDADAIGLIHVRSWQATYRSDLPDIYLDTLAPSDRARLWERILLNQSPRSSSGFSKPTVTRSDSMRLKVSAQMVGSEVKRTNPEFS